MGVYNERSDAAQRFSAHECTGMTSSSTSLWLVLVLLVAVTSTLIGLFLKYTHLHTRTHSSALIYIFLPFHSLVLFVFVFSSPDKMETCSRGRINSKKIISHIFLILKLMKGSPRILKNKIPN